MLRGLTVSLLFAVLAAPAYAQDSDTPPASQDNPETRQTDQSEDDYRRSQRRRDAGDIFDDIDINIGSSGSGTILGREVKAIDRLDPESRRHLNRQRAKALAEAKPGEPVDAAYEPSDAAKADEYIAKQEEAAWDEMMREANSGLSGMSGQGGGSGGGQGEAQGDTQGDQQGQGQAGTSQAGQGRQGQSGQGQSGQNQTGNRDGAAQSRTSPLRGGSASSAASILDQIKGRSGSSSGSAQPNRTAETPSGSASQSGEANSAAGTAENNRPASGQSQNDAQGASEAQADANVASQSNAQSQSQSQSNAQSQADAAEQARAQAKADAAADAQNDAAHAEAHRETISPLERLKRDPIDRAETGGRTSASDYLNRKKD